MELKGYPYVCHANGERKVHRPHMGKYKGNGGKEKCRERKRQQKN